jgi:hypothetical protein
MRYTLALLILVGCGGEATPEEKLQGEWFSRLRADCAKTLSFSGDMIAGSTTCVSGSTARSDVLSGRFSVIRDQIHTLTTHASCPAGQVKVMESTAFSVNGSSLTVFSAEGALAFVRLPAPMNSTGGQVVFGCFDSQGAFTPMPIHSVP